MKAVTVKFIDDDVERVFYERPADTKSSPKVEIITAGVGTLVLINGQRINGVLGIDLPVRRDEIGPQVVLKLHASEIHQRNVTGEEFKRLRELL